ncbi:autotransporter-associated beta strand repeat-containing protein [Kitasatospora sp. CMC57]|uniref:Autotransporter-associated beta strand repeat-containing protein n=1 Tax=Kitasatospora sp. CMC57 TaxID=3231513 RepID=A0AB33JS53_9ACTN
MKARQYARLLAALVVLAGPVAGSGTAAADGPTDITATVLAGRDVMLNGDSVINLPAGTSTYTGVLSGTGTLRVRGNGVLILTKDSDFQLPESRRRQTVSVTPGSPAFTTVTNPDPPAVIVEAGATLQYGTGSGPAGVIGHYPYQTPGFQLNADNIQVDGTLRLSAVRQLNLGTISGSGLLTQPRFLWGDLDLAGTHPFSGLIDNGTGMHFGKAEYPLELPNVRKVLNQGSAIVSAMTNRTLTLRQDFYQRQYGSDINFHTWRDGKVVMTGVYSYSDQGPDTDPSLSDPAVNLRKIPHDLNTRGINIEGAHVQWGDGSTARFFLPATAANSYINLHANQHGNGSLAFDYNGPVTLGTPISGGQFHQSLDTPATGTVTLNPTPGNAVTFAAPQNYHGTTAIGRGATLLLGTGAAGADGALLSGPDDRITDDGALVTRNATTAVTLANISGAGSFTQSGPAAVTLTGGLSYTGRTTVAGGVLALAGGTLRASEGIGLTGPKAVLDLTKAGEQTVRNLSGVAGATVTAGRLTLDNSQDTEYAGGLVATGPVTKTGGSALTLSGPGRSTGWEVAAGTVRMAAATLTGDAQVRSGTTFGGTGVVKGALGNAGTVAATSVTVEGDYHQDPAGRLSLGGPAALRVTGQVTLAGKLTLDAFSGSGLTLIDHTGAGPVSGTFTDLPEGAEVKAVGRTYRISYRGGDGNDVVLVTGPAAATATGDSAAGVAAPVVADRGGPSLLGWAAGAVCTVLVAVLLLLRRRRRRPARRSHRRR